MSRTPSQQCGHTTPPDRHRIDSVSRAHHPREQIPLDHHQPYPQYEPRHIVPPDLDYERPALATPPGPRRLPSLEHLPERNADPRYTLSSDPAFMNRQSLAHVLPLRTHQHQHHHHHQHHGPTVANPRGHFGPISYEERPSPLSSYGGDSLRHPLKTRDVES